MPLPMVHLFLAEKIGEKLGGFPNAAFLLGSIAPDAIHARPGSNRHDKHGTHFFRGSQWDKAEVARHWELVAQTLDIHKTDDPTKRAFVEGYCVHTLLDMVWIEQVFNVLAMTLRAGGIGFEDIRTKYYAETNACDAVLYQQSPWASEVYQQLAEVEPMGFDQLLSAGEVALWRDTVLGKMQIYKTIIPKETFYITCAGITTLIDALAETILSFLQKKEYTLLSFSKGKK